MIFEALLVIGLLLILLLYVSTKTGEGFFLSVTYSLIAAYILSQIWVGLTN